MADVWISRKRWTCKYCNVTINDDVPSRRHHENGMRHKNNVARALRSLHQENDLKKRNELAAAQQLARIEKVRMDQYGLIQAAARSHRAYDRGTFQMAPASAVPPPLPKPPAPWKPKDTMAAYTTATSLGITPKDEKWREKMENRTSEAVVGEWVPVIPPESSSAGAAEPASTSSSSSYVPPVRSERDGLRAFQLVERTLESEDEDVPIVTKRRRGADADAVKEEHGFVKSEESDVVKEELDVKEENHVFDAPLSQESAPWLAPRMKKEEGQSMSDQAPDLVQQEALPEELPSVKQEASLPPAPPPLSTAEARLDAPAGASSSDPPVSSLFRKRKSRSGQAKKVNSQAFA